MSVNVSGIQLARDDVVEAVREALTGSGLPGEHLKIELTESAIIDNPERTKRVLEALKGLDAQIAMDDFGTGRSEEHTSELQSLMSISYAVFCFKQKKKPTQTK